MRLYLSHQDDKQQRQNDMNINGKQYIVLGEKKISHASGERTEISLKLPRGKKTYYVVVYANGTMSEVV
jgi:hypothetical protein